jgi:hypothetical protein
MKKSIIIIFLILTMINSVYGSFTCETEYDYYMDLNTDEIIKYMPYYSDTTQVRYVVGNSTLNMSYDEDEEYYYIYVNSPNEQDINFYTYEIGNQSQEFFNHDEEGDTSYILDNNTERVVYKYDQIYRLENGTKSMFVCVTAKSKIVNRNIKLVYGFNYTPGDINWVESPDNLEINPTDFAIYCDSLNYDIERSDYYTEWVGFRCVDCGVLPDTLRIKVDNTTQPFNTNLTSWTFNDADANLTEFNGNFMIDSIMDCACNKPEGDCTRTLRFREPFYYTFELYRENNSLGIGDLKPYCNDFSYLYMISEDDEDEEWVNFNTPIIDDLMGIKPSYNYNNPVFWNYYDDCSAEIKLYELGNYTLNVVSSKVRPPKFIEFYDWRNTGYKFDEKLMNFEITDKENLTYKVYTSDYEISKMWFALNILKWVAFIVIPGIVLFVVSHPSILVRLITK